MGLAEYVNAHFQMLGLGSGAIRYCRATADGTYEMLASMPDTIWRLADCFDHPDPTTHDDECASERLALLDDNGDANDFEATCLFNDKHYALGMGDGIFDTYADVVREFPSIEWQYRTGATEPTWEFHTCDEVPWIEIP